MIDKLISAVIGFVAGGFLGAFYFGGLWITVQRLPTAKNPALLTLASMYGRLILTLGGFFVIWKMPLPQEWMRLLAMLAGFIIVRTILVHRLGNPVKEGKQ